MRGKVFLELVQVTFDRITPAYAGKSSLYHHRFAFPKDHPRLCGEKFPVSKTSPVQLGSPPPMRGKGVPAAPKVQHIGITPAYAGKRDFLRTE